MLCLQKIGRRPQMPFVPHVVPLPRLQRAGETGKQVLCATAPEPLAELVSKLRGLTRGLVLRRVSRMGHPLRSVAVGFPFCDYWSGASCSSDAVDSPVKLVLVDWFHRLVALS